MILGKSICKPPCLKIKSQLQKNLPNTDSSLRTNILKRLSFKGFLGHTWPVFFFLIIRIYTYTIVLKNTAEIIPTFNHCQRVQLRTQCRHGGHWRLKALEWRKLSPILWGESQKYQAPTSPPPSVRRWVRAGGRNRAHVSSRPCRAPSYLHQATLCPHPGQGPCLSLSLVWRLRVSSEEEAAIHSKGCLLPHMSNNPRMEAFRSPQQGTITKHQTHLKKVELPYTFR